MKIWKIVNHDGDMDQELHPSWIQAIGLVVDDTDDLDAQGALDFWNNTNPTQQGKGAFQGDYIIYQ